LTPEGKVKDKIKKMLKYHKIWYCMPATYGFGVSGVPDFVCCARGKFFGIEAKAKNGALTPLQMKAAADIAQAGGMVHVQWGDDDYNTLDAHLRLLA
jgi:hypothetical protein